ncbi:MAG: ATP-binding protein, partial [Nitrospirota bacterium]
TVDVHKNDGGVEFSVADTGIGIAPENLAIIFEPFRQIESPLTRQRGGIGLGLYVVKRLLEILRGTIKVNSEVGRGSTFRVWIPEDMRRRNGKGRSLHRKDEKKVWQGGKIL